MPSPVAAILTLALCLFIHGCGGDAPKANAPTTTTSTAAQAPAKPAPDDPDFVRARDVMAVVNRYHNRGGGFLVNAAKGFGMYPERSRRGLLLVVEKKAKGWVHAFSFLRRLPGGDDLGPRLLALFRSDAHAEGRSQIAWTLGHFGVTEAGPEIFAHLKSIDPAKKSFTFGPCARGFALIPPKDALPFVLEKLKARPLLPGRSLGPLAESLGRLDPAAALKLLPPLIDEKWDVAGYRGVMRGLGATGLPEGRDALIAFVKRIYASQDHGNFAAVRRYGDAFYEALGEIARFHDETAWPIVLTHDHPFSNGTREAQARVEEAVKKVPKSFIDKWVSSWARWPEKGRFGKRFVILGKGILQRRLDPKLRGQILANIHKFLGNKRYDGNLREATVKLTPWAEAGDAEVIAKLRQIASRPGFDCFSSREAAYQVLSKIHDPEYPRILVKLGDTGTGWNRIEYPVDGPVPGLAKLVMSKTYKGGLRGGGGPAQAVLEVLGKEGDPAYLAHVKKEIAAAMASPKDSLLPQWIRGLGFWKDGSVVPYLRELVTTLKGKGAKLGTMQRRQNSGPARLQAGLYATCYALCQLGIAEGLDVVYHKELDVLPNMTRFSVPPCFRRYVDRYPGPFKADWPSLDEMRKRCVSI